MNPELLLALVHLAQISREPCYCAEHFSRRKEGAGGRQHIEECAIRAAQDRLDTVAPGWHGWSL